MTQTNQLSPNDELDDIFETFEIEWARWFENEKTAPTITSI